MKNKKLLTNILFAAVVLAIAAVLLAVRSRSATGGKLAAQLIYGDRKSTRLNSSHRLESRMPSSA